MFAFTVESIRRPLVGLCATAALTGLFSAAPALAQTTMTEAQQTAAITSLQSAVTTLQTTINGLKTTINTQQTTINSLQTTINSLKTTVNSQATTISALQQKTAPISILTDTTRTDGKKNTELVFTGVNVHIVSGSGATNDNAFSADGSPIPGAHLLGLGNLTIGYNALNNSQGYGNVRTGSHNLILGDSNNYSSFGGVIAGLNNSINGRFDVVMGGECQLGLADEAVVIGGENNTVQVRQGSILGGQFNLVTSRFGTVVGGQNNTAGGADDPNIAAATTVTGGLGNYAGGQNSVISGGRYVVTWAGYGWAAGSEGSQNSWFTNYRSP